MRPKCDFSEVVTDGRTDKPTDGRTNERIVGRTDPPSYRDAMTYQRKRSKETEKVISSLPTHKID